MLLEELVQGCGLQSNFVFSYFFVFYISQIIDFRKHNSGREAIEIGPTVMSPAKVNNWKQKKTKRVMWTMTIKQTINSNL